MATVLIKFGGGDVPVVTGAKPASPQDPIANPTPVGGNTNHPFILAAGIYCFGLDTAIPHKPLSQIGHVIDGMQLDLEFEALP